VRWVRRVPRSPTESKCMLRIVIAVDDRRDVGFHECIQEHNAVAQRGLRSSQLPPVHTSSTYSPLPRDRHHSATLVPIIGGYG
jgi:hypothetical protein